MSVDKTLLHWMSLELRWYGLRRDLIKILQALELLMEVEALVLLMTV